MRWPIFFCGFVQFLDFCLNRGWIGWVIVSRLLLSASFSLDKVSQEVRVVLRCWCVRVWMGDGMILYCPFSRTCILVPPDDCWAISCSQPNRPPIIPMSRVFLFSFPSRPTPPHHLLHTISYISNLCSAMGAAVTAAAVVVVQWKTKTFVCFPLSWSKLFPWDDGWTHGDGRMFHSGLSASARAHIHTHIVRRLDSCACFYSNTDWGLGGVLLAAAGRSGYWERSYPSSLATRWWWWAEFKGRN